MANSETRHHCHGDSESSGSRVDDDWINYTDMDTQKYTCFLTMFGVASTVLTHPLNVVVTRQQAGPLVTGDTTNGTISTMRSIFSRFGARGLLRGWASVALLGIPSQVIYLNMIESSRELFQASIKNAFPRLESVYVDGLQSTGSAIVANMCSYIAFVPGEVISSRLMVQPKMETSTSDMVRHLHSTGGGWRSFYVGYYPSLVVGTIFSSGWWWIYSVFRRNARTYAICERNASLTDMVAGFVAGVGAGVIAHPFDTMKTRVMTGQLGNAGYWRGMGQVWRAEGTKALFRGLMPSLYITCLSSTGFAAIYEILKSAAKEESSL